MLKVAHYAYPHAAVEGGCETMWRRVLPLMMLWLAGCASTQTQQAAESFAVTSNRAGQVSGQALLELHRGIGALNRRQQQLVLESQPGIPARQPLPLEHTVQRMAAANALAQYGEALTALARQDRSPEAAAAFSGLIDSTLAATGLALPVAPLRALGDELAERHFLQRKLTQVKTLMRLYQPAVDQLTELLVEDFSPEGSGYMALFLTSAAELRLHARQRLTDSQVTASQRRDALAALEMAEQAREQGETLGHQLVEMLTELRSAQHATLLQLEEGGETRPALAHFRQGVGQTERMMLLLNRPEQEGSNE